MPDVTVDQAELDRLRRLAGLVNTLETDPRSRGLIEQAVKIHHPEVRTGADEVAELAKPIVEPLQARLEAAEATIKGFQEAAAAAATTQVETGLEQTFSQLRATGYTDKGIEEIKALMVSRNIADPMAAALLFDHQNPKPDNSTPSWAPQHWDTATDMSEVDTKALFENEDKWADKQVGIVLADERSKRAA